MIDSYEHLLDALRNHGSDIKETGHGKAMAQCPAHDDRNPSLSITKTEGRTLLYCHAGCPTKDVLADLDLSMRDVYNEPFEHSRYGTVYAVYTYPDDRVVLRTAAKEFPQPDRAKNKGTALFHADRIGDAETVFVVEGEEDVYAVESLGGTAVSPPMGAGKRPDRFDWPLDGRNAVVVADNDKQGQVHARQVAVHLCGIAGSVRIVQAAVGKDVSDHIAAGKTLDELVPISVEPSVLDQHAVSGAWLDQQEFPPLEYSVDGIVPEGLGILVAPPKKGKSFLVADVGLAVAAGGLALQAIPVTKRPVLYLALEDGHRRLQDRFRRILTGRPIPEGIDVVIKASPMQALQVIGEYLQRHRAGKPLIIVDTLGKIKPPKRPGADSYQLDYEIGGALKALADTVPGSTLLIVHHTRKEVAVDFVDSVSGTQGIAGSVDFVLALDRKRHANDAVLNVTGRDVIEAEYALMADEGILWRLDGANLAAASGTVEQRRAQEKMSGRRMEVFRFVDKSDDAVTATDVAKALDGMDGDTAGKYLRRLAADGYITRVGRGQYLGTVSEVSEVSETGQTGRSEGQPQTDTTPVVVSEVSETPSDSNKATPRNCPACGLGINPALGITVHHDCAARPHTQTDTSDTSDTSDSTDTSDSDRAALHNSQPVPGDPTDNTPGMTERVQRMVAKSQAS